MADSKCCCFPLKSGLMGLAIVNLCILGIVFIVIPFCANPLEEALTTLAEQNNSYIDAEFYAKCIIAVILIGTIISAIPIICFIIGVRNVSTKSYNRKEQH